MAAEMGTVDRSYLLHEQLGEGGMGTVYRATQLVTGQVVALKLVPQRLLPENGDDSTGPHVHYRLALAREFQTLASLHHPNVIRVLGYGFDEQLGPYFVMDLLESARPLVDGSSDLPSEEQQVRLIAQLLRALAYIHRRGVIHRDIKPGNVLVVGDELKLLDFGISVDKVDAAEFAGTIDYMAPELMRGEPPSAASDLYAVGVLLHQMILGRFPSSGVGMDQMLDDILGEDYTSHQLKTIPPDNDILLNAPTLQEPMLDVVHVPPVTAEIPGPLGEVVAKLLAQDPAQRYKDANVVLRDLAAAVPYELPVETAATRESFLRANVLIGREAELRILTHALSQTKHGVGSAFLVSGESGVGKSRLIAELRTLGLVHGSWSAEGQSVAEGGRYYQEWLPLLRALCFRDDLTDAEASVIKDLVPDISRLLGREIPDPPKVKPEDALARLASMVVGVLARQTRPLVLILEDLHWARSESLALLSQIVKHVPKLQVLLIGTFRSDEQPQLPEMLPDMQLIPLQRLDAQNIARLSESMLGAVGQSPELVSYLLRQTEGNVFFLVEIVRALAENAGELERIGQGELPEIVLTSGIERIVERRVDQVSESFRPVLEFAATLGRKLDVPVLQMAFPSTPMRSFLIECANAAILESHGTEWRFAHNKLRETILRRLEPGLRKRLHQDVAEAIEVAHSGTSRGAMSATLAYHFQHAGLPDKALHYYVQAGDSASKLALLEEARAHYAAAEKILGQLPQTSELSRLHVDILLRQVNAGLVSDTSQVQLRRLAEARTLLEGLLGTPDALPSDRLRMARVDYNFGRTYHYGSQPREAIYYYQRVLPVAQEFADQELLIIPFYVIGSAMCLQGHFGKARDMLAQATAPMIKHFGDTLDTRRCMIYHCIALGGSGYGQQALTGLEQVRSLLTPQDQPVYHAVFFSAKCLVAIVMGNWPNALQISEQWLNNSTEMMYQVAALDCMAWAQSHLGLHAEAIKSRSRVTEFRNTMGRGAAYDWFDAAEAEIQLNAGHPESALQQAQRVAASSREAGLPFSQAIAERVWACALNRLSGDMATIEEHLTRSLEISRDAEQVLNVAQAELAWGQICRERGDSAAARIHFDSALALIESGGYEYALSQARRIAGTG